MTILQSSTFLNQSTTFSSSSSSFKKGRSIQEQQDLIHCCYTNRIEQQLITTKLYAIFKEAIVDRVEMHKNICEQRSHWNTMLLTSIKCITLVAATITSIASTTSPNSPIFGLILLSTLTYMAATGMLVIMNRLQPSQLAEEQRNASRLFRNRYNFINRSPFDY